MDTARPPVTVYVEVWPAPERPGKYWAMIGNRPKFLSRQPFLDGARKLLAEGMDPDTPLIMRWTTTGTESLQATVGVAAKLTTVERDHKTIEFDLYRPRSVAVGPPITQNEEDAE